MEDYTIAKARMDEAQQAYENARARLEETQAVCQAILNRKFGELNAKFPVGERD